MYMRTLKETGILTKLLSGLNFDGWWQDAELPLREAQPPVGATTRFGQPPTANGKNVMPDVTQQELLAAIKQRFDFLESCDFEPWRGEPAGRTPARAPSEPGDVAPRPANGTRAGS